MYIDFTHINYDYDNLHTCRNLLESRSFLIIPYVIYSLLPLLWTTSLLPPLDALIFWIIEQTVIHLMGGSATASELR